MNHLKWIFLAGMLVSMFACTKKTGDVMILFVEQEPGVEPYQTRLIVTPDFMRFDDGEASADFVLYDRKKNIIYSTNSTEMTVMSVSEKDTDNIKPPFELKNEVKKLGVMQDAPRIDNKSPLHYQFFTNGVQCYDVVIVDNLMPDVVSAMQSFHSLLASDSRLTFNSMPADMQKPCDMSMSTFAAGQHLQYGFPVHEWTPAGTGRTMVDFDVNYKADKKLFELPADYRLFSVQDFREGKVKFE